jgi:putative tricarboxylic transport membrane protein
MPRPVLYWGCGMRRADQVFSIVILIFSIFVIRESWELRQPPIPGSLGYEPGAEFLPLWVSIGMAILSLALFISTTLKPKESIPGNAFPTGKSLFSIFLLLIVLALYILLLDVIGYLISTLLLILITMRFIMQATWKSSISVSILTSSLLYVVFKTFLSVDLPVNTFGF